MKDLTRLEKWQILFVVVVFAAVGFYGYRRSMYPRIRTVKGLQGVILDRPDQINMLSYKLVASLQVGGDIGLKDHDIRVLGKMINLKFLELSGNRISAEEVSWSALSKLWYLDLSYTRCDDLTMQHLGESPAANSLTDLSLSNTRITDHGAHQIAHMKSLTRLRIEGTQITGAGLSEILQSCPKLEELFVPASALTDEALSHIHVAHSLRIFAYAKREGVVTVILDRWPQLRDVINFERISK